MAGVRRAARVDRNQTAIVEALRQAGCSVQVLSRVGQGCPDILVGRAGRNLLLEIKAEGGTLTPDEQDWHNLWDGQVALAWSVDDALKVVGVI